jgi:hypothetical protein
MDKSWANTNSQDSPRPGFGGSHHIPPYSILYAWPRGQHPNVILSRDSQVGVPKFLKLGLSQLWRPITLCANLLLRWNLKQSCSPHQELSNGMWHATFMQGNQGNFWFLVVKSQIGNLTLDPSFGHNLCFKCSNGLCEPILDIYVLKYFQRYKKLLNPMSFDPCNCLMKIGKSIGTPIPKMRFHLGVWEFIPSHFLTLPWAWNVTLGLHSWPTPL